MLSQLTKRLSLMAVMLGLLALTGYSQQSQASELIINTDTSDVAPKKAFTNMIADFEATYPDIKVTWNLFDHEGFKTSIRNFLTTSAPDVFTWYAGNRMLQFVNPGLVEDVSDVWAENNLEESMKSAASAMTIDGKKWGVPYTYYNWGIYYRKDIFAEHGLTPPTTWAELLAVSEKLNNAGVKPFSIGSKYLWTTAGWFDYLNLRVNGSEFHRELTAGNIPYTDPRVREVFERWGELVKPGYFIDSHTAYSWQEALPFVVRGDAAMYLIGNFVVEQIKSAGLDEDNLAFFPFPEITPGIPRAEDAPTDTLHIAAKAKNKENARLFLAYAARADVQTKINKTLRQLPVNGNSSVIKDTFLQQGFELVSTASDLAQFFDRDANPEMAQIGMNGFQEFMVKPERLDDILARLEKERKRIHN